MQVVFNHLFTYVLPLEIQVSRAEDWDLTYRFNPATFLCLDLDFQRHMTIARSMDARIKQTTRKVKYFG
jgi:hypothetical protein